MSKFNVGDSVRFADSLHGEVLYGKIVEVETRSGKTFYFVSYGGNGVGEYASAPGWRIFYRKPESRCYATGKEAKSEWLEAEIARKQAEITKLKKELKECFL